jgi:hypothetical protein
MNSPIRIMRLPSLSLMMSGKGEGAEKRYKRSINGWEKISNGLKEVVESEK